MVAWQLTEGVILPPREYDQELHEGGHSQEDWMRLLSALTALLVLLTCLLCNLVQIVTP